MFKSFGGTVYHMLANVFTEATKYMYSDYLVKMGTIDRLLSNPSLVSEANRITFRSF